MPTHAAAAAGKRWRRRQPKFRRRPPDSQPDFAAASRKRVSGVAEGVYVTGAGGRQRQLPP